jgi:hypothetical protein
MIDEKDLLLELVQIEDDEKKRMEIMLQYELLGKKCDEVLARIYERQNRRNSRAS